MATRVGRRIGHRRPYNLHNTCTDDLFVDKAGIIHSRVRRALTLEEMQAGVRALQRNADECRETQIREV
jgi:hypothetical protein